MKIIFLTLFLILKAQASTVEVVGPCSEAPQFISEDIKHDEKMSLGDLTIQVFEQNKISYQGSREGMTAILDSPIGDEAIEQVSSNEIRFYGWCVQVDGFEPGDMPDQVLLKNVNSKIVWFYAYATSLNGKWTEMCTPAYTKKSLAICKK